MSLDEANEDDYIEEVNAIKVIMDKTLKERAGNIEIDFSENFFGKGYTIKADSKGCF